MNSAIEDLGNQENIIKNSDNEEERV